MHPAQLDDPLAPLEPLPRLPRVPTRLERKWRENLTVFMDGEKRVMRQMQSMGIPEDEATQLYAHAWIDDDGKHKPRDISPFAVTDHPASETYPVSFVTRRQVATVFEDWMPTQGSEIACWALIAGHERGHHLALKHRAAVLGAGGYTLDGVDAILGMPNKEWAMMPINRLIEGFGDMIGGLGVLKEEPINNALSAVKWVQESRKVSLVYSLDKAARKPTLEPDATMTLYAVHHASEHLLQNADRLRPKLQGATEDDMVEIACDELKTVYPVMNSEAQLLHYSTSRWLQAPRTRGQMQRALHKMKLRPADTTRSTVPLATMLSDQVKLKAGLT